MGPPPTPARPQSSPAIVVARWMPSHVCLLSGIALVLGTPTVALLSAAFSSCEENGDLAIALVAPGVVLFLVAFVLAVIGEYIAYQWVARSRRDRDGLGGATLVWIVGLALGACLSWATVRRAPPPTSFPGPLVSACAGTPARGGAETCWTIIGPIRMVRRCNADRTRCELSVAGPGESLPSEFGMDPHAIVVAGPDPIEIFGSEPGLSPRTREAIAALRGCIDGYVCRDPPVRTRRVPLWVRAPRRWLVSVAGMVVAALALLAAAAGRARLRSIEAGRAATLGPNGTLAFADGTPSLRLADRVERDGPVVVTWHSPQSVAVYRTIAATGRARWIKGDRTTLIRQWRERIGTRTLLAIASTTVAVVHLGSMWAATR